MLALASAYTIVTQLALPDAREVGGEQNYRDMSAAWEDAPTNGSDYQSGSLMPWQTQRDGLSTL